MNHYINKFIVIAFFISSSYCHAQQLMQTTKELDIIGKNDDKFIGRPLSVLLNDIKPVVKMVFVEGGWEETAPRISFFFMTREEYQNCVRHKGLPMRLTVNLKNTFKWTMEERTAKHYLEWTIEDKEMLASNIVTRLTISGDCDDCQQNFCY